MFAMGWVGVERELGCAFETPATWTLPSKLHGHTDMPTTAPLKRRKLRHQAFIEYTYPQLFN